MDNPAAERTQALQKLEEAFQELMTTLGTLTLSAAEITYPGMSPNTFKTLTVIDRLGTVTARELAERFYVDKSIISRHISELEKHGLVERTRDPHDQRSRVIAVTSAAKEKLREARDLYLQRFRTQWPTADITELTRLLTAFSTDASPTETALAGGIAASTD